MSINDDGFKRSINENNKVVIGDTRGSQALWNAITMYIIRSASTSSNPKMIEESLQHPGRAKSNT